MDKKEETPPLTSLHPTELQYLPSLNQVQSSPATGKQFLRLEITKKEESRTPPFLRLEQVQLVTFNILTKLMQASASLKDTPVEPKEALG